jgi:4-hydroxy-tetrahydrodipicolinate synthase
MDKPFTIRGVIPPLFTPFTDHGAEVDEGALRAHVQWLVERGVHGLMPCGTTGEGALLAAQERKRLVEVVVEAAAHRVPVMAHVGTAVTRETVELALHARASGAEAVSVVTPYYFHLSDGALVGHYCRVAEAVADTPVFLYNIPQNTGNRLSPAVVEAIVARCPNVVGIKDSSGSLGNIAEFVEVGGRGFQVVCGSDGLLLRALRAGACASVSGNANVFPEVVTALFEAFWRGDWEGACRQQELLDSVRRLLSNGDNLALMKRGLELRGLRGGTVRPPLPEVSEEMVAELERGLRALDLLG